MKTLNESKNFHTSFKSLRNPKALYVLMAVFMLSLASACKKGGGLHNCDVTADLNELTAATQAFSNDPTVANCEAVKKVNLKLLQKLDKCPSTLGSDWKTQIEDAKNMDCSDFE